LLKFGVEKWRKSMQKWPPKISSKKCSKIDFQGGVPGGQNDQNRGGGSGGVPFYKFFEILQFSTKAPPLFDPKIDPQKGPYKNVIPHK
jgi:hypothetical protein